MGERIPIQRGNIVRVTRDRRDYYGTAFTSEAHRGRINVRVEWYPDFGTWENPEDLTVISVFDMGAK